MKQHIDYNDYQQLTEGGRKNFLKHLKQVFNRKVIVPDSNDFSRFMSIGAMIEYLQAYDPFALAVTLNIYGQSSDLCDMLWKDMKEVFDEQS